MVERGFVISEPDGHQADRAFVTLASGMSAALRRYFAEVIEAA